jgi:hypothetical protein
MIRSFHQIIGRINLAGQFQQGIRQHFRPQIHEPLFSVFLHNPTFLEVPSSLILNAIEPQIQLTVILPYSIILK